MAVEENLALARRFLEAQVKGDLDAMDEMMTPGFVGHTKLLPDQQPDREGQKWAYAQFSAATSNPSIHLEDQIAAGDKVVSRFVVHAIKTGVPTERGDYQDYLSSLALPRLQHLCAPENLCLEPGHEEVSPQGLLGRLYLKLCGPEVALQEQRSILWFSPTPPTL